VKRVAIVYPRANIDSVPSLVGAAEAFADRGYDVDLYTLLQAGEPDPRFSSPLIRPRSLGTVGLADQTTAGLRGAVKSLGWMPSVARAPLVQGYRALNAGLGQGSQVFARLRRNAGDRRGDRYDCVIGVDADGLELAYDIARGAPVGYYSLELLLSYDLSTLADRQLKVRERALSRRAAFVVVQDQGRAQLLVDDNDLAWDRVVLVPNAPPGPAERRPSRAWHARLGLPAAARVVLHSGSLGDWTGIDAIVASATTWPQPWLLVVHTRYDAESSDYVEALRRLADPDRVRFSLRPVPRQDYDALIDGAEVGLAFYVSTAESAFTGTNVHTIGLSSGKLAYYLRSGLPVIVNSAASIAESIEARGCGVAIRDADQIGRALAVIDADYDRFSAAACRFFSEELDFQRAFGRVLDRVEALRVVA
jgi:glycosyltransferase involved in cell wall biosynthesis